MTSLSVALETLLSLIFKLRVWVFGKTWNAPSPGVPVPPKMPSLFDRISVRMGRLSNRLSDQHGVTPGGRIESFSPPRPSPFAVSESDVQMVEDELDCDGEDSIPVSWLEERTTIEVAEAAHLIDGRPFGYGAPQWRALTRRARPSDQIWWFGSPPDSWRAHAGRMGLALIRDGKVMASITTMMT